MPTCPKCGTWGDCTAFCEEKSEQVRRWQAGPAGRPPRNSLHYRIERVLDSLNRYAANGLDIPNKNIPELIATLEGDA